MMGINIILSKYNIIIFSLINIVSIILLCILLKCLLIKNGKKELFTNYIIVNEPINNFYYRFIDYVLNNRKKKNYLIYDKYGYHHLLDPRYDPKVINPQFIFDEGLRYNYKSKQKLIPI